MAPDLAVVGQDPAFGDGGRAHLDAFLAAARELGRVPELHHGRMPSPFRPVDSLNQLAAGLRISPRVRTARDLWVVASFASYGFAAALSRRPYSCWIGTALEDEWRGRRPGLRPSRRLAIRVNAPVLRRLERRVLRGAKRVYATSPWSRATVARAAGLPEEEVAILPLPVDVDRLTPAPEEEWRKTLEAPVLAFVGRANDPRKNVRLLLDAMPLLPEVRLLLVGEPPPRPLPERVEAVGTVPSILPRLHRASLFVLPSRQEGFGIAAAEALAAGLPVVTTACGGPEALVRDSGAGAVLSGWSPEELATTVRTLLEDPDRLAAMRTSGRAHVVREHSPARLRELLERAFAA
ncbi:MAG TPA: glycosyltransferase family 4 protein [Gaiellaceae bacterium]|nr:glycosyltransferase family 4 protein [Gaiellaceae bacterium]